MTTDPRLLETLRRLATKAVPNTMPTSLCPEGAAVERIEQLDAEVDRLNKVVEGAKMARTRLERFADEANAGRVHHDARELKTASVGLVLRLRRRNNRRKAWHMSRQDDFDRACAEFTSTMLAVADWQNRYFGASYSTRIAHAVDDARTAIARIEAAIVKNKHARYAAISSGIRG